MTTRLSIDLGALVANYQLICDAARPGTAGAVVKANAYGLGDSVVAGALWGAGCRDFFVATSREGVALRAALTDAAIYVFEGVRDDTLPELLSADLIPVLNHRVQLEIWRAGGGGPAAVHIDTGLHRLGFPPDVDATDFCGVPVCLLMTHLACADDPDHPMNRRQLERFAAARKGFPGVPVSIGNAAAILQGGDMVGDVARPGVGLFGGNPFVGRPNPMRPVVTLEGRILQIREIAAGATVGYGASYTVPAPLRAAVVGLGYADGLPRLLSNRGEAAVSGRRCPIIGRVSMDLTVIDVSAVDADLDDWVEFFGPTIPVDEVAGWAGTIAYEVLTGIGPRPRRVYRRP